MKQYNKPYVKLQMAYALTIFTVLAFIFLFIFIGIQNRKTAYEDSKLLAIEVSRKAAFETQVYLSSALMTARSIEQRVMLVREYHGNREHLREILENSLQRSHHAGRF